MDHVRGTPYHPQTQGKIERSHRTLKNHILLEDYYLPGDLQLRIDAFTDHHTHQRYHQGLQNLTRPGLLRTRRANPETTRKDQTKDHGNPVLASTQSRRIVATTR